MTTLPTVGAVRAIITTSLPDAVIESLIADAELMVENCISTLGASRQTAIIKWVTAHLISSVPGASGGVKEKASSSLGDASDTYAKGPFGDALKGTTYGKQAIALDPNGCLANLGKRKVGFTVL